MNILLVNDDGIRAPGLQKLAEAAVTLGSVTVVAPHSQCSAMSQRITIFDPIEIFEHPDFPAAVEQAYSITGTPADCVKVGCFLLGQKPDIVFSGINRGFNAGFDIAYSGTVGACLEALMEGIPAIAFSNENDSCFDVAERELLPLAKDLLQRPIRKNELWNVNFPACLLSDYHGILEDRRPASMQLYSDCFIDVAPSSGVRALQQNGFCVSSSTAPEGTDIHAVLHGYTSVGRIRCHVLDID